MDEERKYDPVTPAAKQDIRPNFLGGQGGGESIAGTENGDRGGLYNDTKGSDAAKALKSAEDSATNADMGQSEDSLAGTKANEESAGGLYSGISDNKPKKGKGGLKGKLIKGGPIAVILFAIFGIGGILAGTQSFQMFDLAALFQNNYHSMYPSVHMRSAKLIKWQLGGVTRDPVKGSKLFGTEHFKISDKQKEELKRHGIDYDEDLKALKYTNSKGERITVTAADFDSVYKNDLDFAQKYDSGSKTWRGLYANMYNTVTNNFLRKNKLTRNLYKNYLDEKAAAGDDGTKVVQNKLEERTGTIEDENGQKVKRSDLDNEKVKAKLNSITSKLGGGGVLSAISQSTCTFVEAATAIGMLVYASESLQILSLTMSAFESVDKTKAGLGNESPMSEIATMLNEPAENTNEVLLAGSGGTLDDPKYETKTVTTKKSAIASEGLAALYEGRSASPYDPSVQSFNIGSSMRSILGGIGSSMDVFRGCSFAKMATAVIDGALEGVEVGACIAGILAGGVSGFVTCAPLVASVVIGVSTAVAINTAIGALVGAITPMVAGILTRDLTGKIGGVDLGNAIASGGLMYFAFIHKANGGSLMSRGAFSRFAIARQQILAEDAEKERRTLSPFDITSRNTFMGNIMLQLMNYNNANSLMSILTSSNSVVSSSLVALAPSSVAATKDLVNGLMSDEEYSNAEPYLADIGAVGNAFGYYTGTDLSTMDYEIGEVIDILDGVGAFSGETSDGNVVVDKNSDLFKYIRYVDQRTSQFGVPDLNIKNEVISGTSTGNDFVDGGIGAIPVVGSALDALTEGKVQENFGYISGASGVATDDGSSPVAATNGSGFRLAASVSGTAANPNWNLAKFYQRFIEDQSLLESMGVIDKSAVTVALEEYYEENPLDDSYEGLLARYSGLDKESVNDLLDIIAYYNYIGNYDPTERYAFGEPVVDEEEKAVRFEDENVLGGEFVALEGIVYRDERNRTFAV